MRSYKIGQVLWPYPSSISLPLLYNNSQYDLTSIKQFSSLNYWENFNLLFMFSFEMRFQANKIDGVTQ